MDYLVQINGCWYYRRRVPSDLQDYFPFPEIKRSLRATRRRDARTLAAALHEKVERLFLYVRMKPLTDDQIRELVAIHFSSLLDGCELRRNECPSRHSPTLVKRTSEAILSRANVLQEDLATGRYLDNISSFWDADRVLKQAGISIDRNSPVYRGLLRELFKVQIDFLRIESERWRGNYDSEIERRVLAKIDRLPKSVPPSPVIDLARLTEDIVAQVFAKVVPPRCTVTLGEAVATCLEHMEVDGNQGRGLAPTSLIKYHNQYPLLVELLGGSDRSLVDIQPLELLAVRKKLLGFPANRNTGRYRNMGLEEILAADIPPEHRMGKRTVNSYMSRLSSLFEFASRPTVWGRSSIADTKRITPLLAL